MISKKQDGFSIVEVALVLILIGFTASTAMLALTTYTAQARVDRTKEALELSKTALIAFASENGRYPCPALLTDAAGTANFGYEVPVAGRDAISNIGRNDIDNAGGNEDYLYGAVPFNTILNTNNLPGITSPSATLKNFEYSAAKARDGWNNKIVYAISRHLCEPFGTPQVQRSPEGVLDIITAGRCTDAGGATHPQSVLPGSCNGADRRYAQFVLLSHGENERGAINELGNTVDTCIDFAQQLPLGDANEGGNRGDWFNGFPSDRKNCKYAANITPEFTNQGQFYYGLRTEGNDAQYYDDYITFYYEDNFQIFASAPPLIVPATATTPEFQISRIENVNTGDIGIGVQNPLEVLHIDGDLQATDIYAGAFCARIDTATCTPPAILGGTGISCPAGEVIRSIENNTVNCTPPFAGINFACPNPGERLQTIRSDGTFDCIIP